MAMTKKEKAHIDTLERELKSAIALKVPDYTKPEPLSSYEIRELKGNDTLVAVWFFVEYQTYAYPGWTNGTCHYVDITQRGELPRNRAGWVQGAGRCYRSRKEALRALRWEHTRRAMSNLAYIDQLLTEGAAGDEMSDGRRVGENESDA